MTLAVADSGTQDVSVGGARSGAGGKIPRRRPRRTPNSTPASSSVTRLVSITRR